MESKPSPSIGISIPPRKSVSVPTPNTKRASAPSSAKPSAVGSAPTVPACIVSQGNRVVLSGIGGDEFTGGVPTPNPELADLLARGHFRTLAHQLKVWALNKRKPWFHLLFGAAREFLSPALVGVPKHKRPAAWFNPAFVKRNRAALTGYDDRTRTFGPLPSFQANLVALDVLRRQLACSELSLDLPREQRY